MRDVHPMLATAGELPTAEQGWAYELKWDGVRAVVAVDERGVRARSRTGKDLTGAFPELTDLAPAVRGHTVVLDGEIVALDEKGRPSFGRLQQRLTTAKVSRQDPVVRSVPATYLVFDLLSLDGHELIELSYDDRRTLLSKLSLAGATFATPTPFLEMTGAQALEISKELGMEGIVAKRRDAPYSPGRRSRSWIKVKNFRTQEVIIGGWTEGRNALFGSLGALLLGVPANEGLRYVGKVGTGFTDRSRQDLLSMLSPLARDTSPFAGRLGREAAAGAHFVQPLVVAEVRYGEWTHEGHLRHPVWRGLRPDKKLEDVTIEP